MFKNNNFQKQHILCLSTRTWIRDSHGLYDYESIQTKNLNLIIGDSIKITRLKNDIKTSPIDKKLQNDEELILNIKYQPNNDTYKIENPVKTFMQTTEENISNLSNKIWYVLKSEEINNQNLQKVNNINEDYYLCKNDIIKLGRVKYSLNQISITENLNIININSQYNNYSYNIENINNYTEPVFNFISIIKNEINENNEENLCKICYSNDNNENNPLIHLCNCQGGIKFAHYLCIKKWMETKLIIKENEKKTVKSYNIKSFNCEICKTPYPYKFKIEGKKQIFNLIDIQKPNNNFIILESLNQLKDNCNIKSIHVINLNDDEIKIGRGHECDVRINDISVSRIHALLKYDKNNGKLLIRNLKSKFGTLILLKNPFFIKEKKIDFQIGRTFIEAYLMNIKDFEIMKNIEKIQKEKELLKRNSIKNKRLFGNINSKDVNSKNNIKKK